MPSYSNELKTLAESYGLILESQKHLKIILKILHPAVANVSKIEADAGGVWFAKELKKNFKEWTENTIDDPDLMAVVDKYLNKQPLTDAEIRYIDTKIHYILAKFGADDLQHIRDWAEGTGAQLKDYSYQEAYDLTQEWLDQKREGTLNQENNKIIKDYGDGWYWVDLETTSCEEEGEASGHCGSTSYGDTLWSLRLRNKYGKIKSWVTVAISPRKKTWYQAKGPRNSKPKKEYFGMIADILKDHGIHVFHEEYLSENDFDHDDLRNTLDEEFDIDVYTDPYFNSITSRVDYNDFKVLCDNIDTPFTNMYFEITSPHGPSTSLNYQVDFSNPSDMRVALVFESVIESNVDFSKEFIQHADRYEYDDEEEITYYNLSDLNINSKFNFNPMLDKIEELFHVEEVFEKRPHIYLQMFECTEAWRTGDSEWKIELHIYSNIDKTYELNSYDKDEMERVLEIEARNMHIHRRKMYKAQIQTEKVIEEYLEHLNNSKSQWILKNN